MTTTASVVLQTVEGSGLLFQAQIPNVTGFAMDSGAQPQAPSPVEALLAALGACAGMDVISILRKKRQTVLGYEVVLSGERRTEHPRSFTRIEILHRVRGRELSDAAIEDAIRLSDTKYCSVHASMAPDIAIVSRHEIIPA